MADWLGIESFDALYVSPMARALQTAAPLEAALGLEATVVEGVKEYDATEDRYIPLEDVKADKAQWREFLADHQARDLAGFASLVDDSLEAIIAGHRGQSVAVVCHGGVINVWAAKVLGLDPSMFFEPEYTSIHRFVAASSGERSVKSLNEVAHLRELD